MTPLGFVRKRPQPPVITDLASSRNAEIRDREKRYIITMSFRVVCFVLATVLFRGAARWIAVALAVALPWIAVVVANAPRALASRHAAYEPKERETPGLAPGREPRVIDHD